MNIISELIRPLYNCKIKVGILGIRNLPDSVTDMKIKIELIGNQSYKSKN